MRWPMIPVAAATGLLGGSALAQPVSAELPFGETPAELAGPGAAVVARNCSACHSLDYITTQPRGKGEQFWRDSVAKMVNVYKAPLSPEEAEAVSIVLATKFG